MADNVRAVVVFGDEFLVLAEKDDPGNWKLPGGSIEEGENPEVAIARGLMKELGLDINSGSNDVNLRFKKLRTDDGKNNRFIFRVNIGSKSMIVPTEEVEQVVWCDNDSVPEGKNKNHILAAYSAVA